MRWLVAVGVAVVVIALARSAPVPADGAPQAVPAFTVALPVAISDASARLTATPTPTPTKAPIQTTTATAVAASATPEPTNTVVATSTPFRGDASSTATASATASSTVAATVTPSTATPTATRTATQTTTRTATPTATRTATRTATPTPTGLALPTPTPETVFVFLQGFNTSSSGTVNVLQVVLPSGFGDLKTRLQARGYQSWNFLDFSYAGGYAIGGNWYGNPYTCADTATGLAAGDATLESLLLGHDAARRAVGLRSANYVLVGHSWGGLLAWRYLNMIRVGTASPYVPRVVGVVTVDSPLMGVSSGKTFFMGLACSGQTLTDLQTLYDNWSLVYQEWVTMGSWAFDHRITAITYWNRNDCAYWPDLTGCDQLGIWSDDRATQIVTPGFECTVPINPAWGDGWSDAIVYQTHRAILHVEPCVSEIATTLDLIADSHAGGTS